MALQLKYRGKTAKGKGRQPLLLLESLTRCELGSKKRTSGVDEVDVASGSGPRGNLDDPYDFIDSQSLQPEPPKTPQALPVAQQGGAAVGRPGKHRTPQSRKKPRTPMSALKKSPAEIKQEQLRQREEEDLKRALEESRKEMVREERRKRKRRREEAEAVEETMEKTIQDSSMRIDEALRTVSTAQAVTEVPIASVDVGGCNTDNTGEFSDDLSQSTPPLSGGPTSSDIATPHSRPSTVRRSPIVQVTKLSHSMSSGMNTPVKIAVTPVSGVSGRRTTTVGMQSLQNGGSGGVARGDGCEREDRWSETPPLVGPLVGVGEGIENVGEMEVDGRRVSISKLQQGVVVGSEGVQGMVGSEGVEEEVGGSEGGINGVPQNTDRSVPLSLTEMGGGGEEGGGDTKTSPTPQCEANSPTTQHITQESESYQRRHTLLLSLRKGKKRLSSGVPGELGNSPPSKRTKVAVDHTASAKRSVESAGQEAVVGNTRSSQLSTVLDDAAQLRAKKQREGQTSRPAVDGRCGRSVKTELPELFAPEGVDPASYTATILHRLNSYVHQLRVAQARVIMRVPWSKPVPVYHRQSRSTLDYRYCQPRHQSRGTAITHGWPTIDLKTGEVSRWASDSTSKHLATRSSKRHSTLRYEEDENSFMSTQTARTPLRSESSQRHKAMCADVSEQQWYVPDQPSCVSHRNRSISSTVHSTTPAPPQPPANETSAPQQSSNPAHLESDPINCDPSTDGTSTDLPSSSTAVVHALSAEQTVESNPTSGQVDIGQPHVGTDLERENEQQEEAERILSSPEGSDMIGVHGSCKRRRGAHLLEDSDSDTEDIEAGSGNMHESSKYSTSNSVMLVNNSAVSSGEVAVRTRVEGKKQKTLNALTAFGRGKRMKRFSFHKLPVKSVTSGQPEKRSSNSANDVIDLTDIATPESPSPSSPSLPRSLHTARRRAGSTDVEVGGESDEERVPCPLCAECFPASAVEAHAASCLEPRAPSPVLHRPSVMKKRPIKQASLLTPRFKKARVPSSSPSESPEPSASWCPPLHDQDYTAGHSEEEEDEREGEGERGGGQASGEESCGSAASGGPRVYECEGGGYQVDPTTISSSPIKTFRRITELDPQERAGYYNQFTKKGRGARGQRGRGRTEFSELMGYTSSRRGGRGKRRGGPKAGGRARGRGKQRFFRGRGKRTG